MRLAANGTLLGYPTPLVRKLFQRGRSSWELWLVKEVLEVSGEEALRFLEAARSEGYVTQDERSGLHNTAKGNAVAMATFAKPISRKTADKVLADFMQRVRTVNEDDHYLYKVIRVVVFGSYLSDKDKLGDIDLAVKMAPKIADRDALMDLSVQRFRESGRRAYSILDDISWAEREVQLFLKSRSRSLSLHFWDSDDKLVYAGPHKVLYETASSQG